MFNNRKPCGCTPLKMFEEYIMFFQKFVKAWFLKYFEDIQMSEKDMFGVSHFDMRAIY